MYRIVSPEEARQNPYPYVFVAESGSVHELSDDDKAYLEQEFHPTDGGRPYVKTSYSARDVSGNLSGFCHHSEIPNDVVVEKPFEKPLIEFHSGGILVKNGTLTTKSGFAVQLKEIEKIDFCPSEPRRSGLARLLPFLFPDPGPICDIYIQHHGKRHQIGHGIPKGEAQRLSEIIMFF